MSLSSSTPLLKAATTCTPIAALSIVVDTEADFESNAELCTALYRHLCHIPPHGAFARLASLTFASEAARSFGIVVKPSLVLQILRKKFLLEHMRAYTPFYFRSDLSALDIEKLMSSSTAAATATLSTNGCDAPVVAVKQEDPTQKRV